jgi:feruloyl esterase
MWRLIALMAAALPAVGATCEDLKSLSLPQTTITLTQSVGAGAFAPTPAAANAKQAPTFGDLPAFCRVTATIKPTSDSEILIEVWMPQMNWNGKLQGNGNGGWTGSINPATLAVGLRRDYATAMTDTGHEGGSGSFALDHPEKLIDFGYRSTHEMTVKAKAIITAFYGREPGISYFSGCSAGGKQGLTEAQLFPGDYSGIIAGAPGNNWTHMMAQIVWVAQAVHKDDASYIPPAKYPQLHDSAVAACDARDGVKDGVIDDPTKCKFDPKVILCKGKDTPACLTEPQVEAARKIYSPLKNPRTKQEIYPGFEPGSELGWGQFVAGPTPTTFATDLFKFVVFKNPEWDYKTLNFDSDVAMADTIDKGVNNATDPNLKGFFERGGKLLQYHGWSDQLIAPRNSPNYYASVEKATGNAALLQNSYRLFMAPGMNHCQGGDGPSNFDMLTALEQWVEQGQAPDRIVAAHLTGGKPDRTRPLCPYPQVAVYNGKGSTDDAQNFTCKVR